MEKYRRKSTGQIFNCVRNPNGSWLVSFSGGKEAEYCDLDFGELFVEVEAPRDIQSMQWSYTSVDYFRMFWVWPMSVYDLKHTKDVVDLQFKSLLDAAEKIEAACEAAEPKGDGR